MSDEENRLMDILKELQKSNDTGKAIDLIIDQLQKTPQKPSLPKKKKGNIDTGEGLKVLCSCGNVITSFYNNYINVLDISLWHCDVCGDSIQIQIIVKDLGDSPIPKIKKESKYKDIRLKCEKCSSTIYAGSTRYVNELKKQSKWRCQDCGNIYFVQKKVIKNPKMEIDT